MTDKVMQSEGHADEAGRRSAGKTFSSRLLIALLTCVAACGGGAEWGGAGSGEEEAGSGVEPEPIEQVPPAVERPATSGVDTIVLEGMPEEIATQTVTAPQDFPLRFRTVAPADMEVRFVPVAGRDAARFLAAFGGTPMEAAALEFVPLPDVTAPEVAADAVAAILDASDAVRRDPPDYPWAIEQYALRGDRSGFVALGSVDSSWFYEHASYPPEYGDGMGPRIDFILRNWAWAPEGEPLIPNGSGNRFDTSAGSGNVTE